MNKKNVIVQNVGFAYDVMSKGLVLCSFPTKRQAINRAIEIASEFDLVYCGCY